MKRSPNGVNAHVLPSPSRLPPARPPSSSASASPPRSGNAIATTLVRPTLPSKDVTTEDIEDAYVRFVLYCNPAVPLDVDTAALRESFRTPPRSGGKSFSTFVLFQLIRQLETKEIKTWAELALKLGVEPPDQDKGQSSQKIQQYAVRLKRWMHSMHVDAFFEYLMDRPHPYWTQIPTDPNPICDAGRDGVAAEDDMALRALLPHIRPRRGRKRPDDDESKSPSQRPRLDIPDEYLRHESLGPWSAHPDGRPGQFPPPPSSVAPPPSNAVGTANAGTLSSWPLAQDTAQTPLTAYPMSAVDPSRGGFWADEPRSAISPLKGRGPHRRHGAKVVSSAWRSGPAGTGKTRGRPPINRTPVDTQFTPATPSSAEQSTFISSQLSPLQRPSKSPRTSEPPPPPPPPPPLPPSAPVTTSQKPISVPQPPTNRPAKPNISLQVPARPTGSVRLATPPPTVLVNGETHNNSTSGSAPIPPPSSTAETIPFKAHATNNTISPPPDVNIPAVNFNPGPNAIPPHPQVTQNQQTPATASSSNSPTGSSQPPNIFDEMPDRTNIDSVMATLVSETMAAEWVDPQGNPAEPCCVEEAHAIVTTVMEAMYKNASSKERFLINLAALVGGRMLMTTSRLRVTREEKMKGATKYASTWEYRLGSVRGVFSMTQVVGHEKWRPPWAGGGNIGTGDDDALPENGAEAPAGDGRGPSYWKKKYEDLVGLVSKRNKQQEEFKEKVVSSLRDAL